MNKILAILLAGLLMITATATIVYAEEEEGAEVAEENETEENETGEEESVPGFEIALAAAGLGAARLLRYRNN